MSRWILPTRRLWSWRRNWKPGRSSRWTVVDFESTDGAAIERSGSTRKRFLHVVLSALRRLPLSSSPRERPRQAWLSQGGLCPEREAGATVVRKQKQRAPV